MKHHKLHASIVIVYAAIILSGGLMGGFIANSTPSLISGIVFGSLIAFNGYKISRQNMKGLTLALIQSVILGSFFVYRLMSTGKLMPALPMIILSFFVAFYLLINHPKEVEK